MVQAFKKPAVHERNLGLYEAHEAVRVFEVAFIAHQARSVLVLPVNAESPLSLLGVEARKKEVLQNRLVVDAGAFGIGTVI
ncbi:MAG: hypothetical protein IJU95_03485, partial [Treponema sp.]|nr:hypothetical protein [Treponema sp.]